MFDGGGVGSGVGEGSRVPPYPPYAPWPAVLSILGHLRAADALPDVLPSADLKRLGLFSPTVVKQILAAFRFMDLIDEANRPTRRMHELLTAHGTPQWPSELAKIVRHAFPEVASLDLSRATRAQLDKAFGAYRGSSEDIRRKCVRFFLSAAREAKIPLSAELFGRPRVPSGMRLRMNAATAHQSQEDGVSDLLPRLPSVPPASQPLPQPRQPTEPERADQVPQDRPNLYGAAYAALKAAWDPGETPGEEVDAAVVTVLRYLRKKEGEATKP
jgi:hypothetical protein